MFEIDTFLNFHNSCFHCQYYVYGWVKKCIPTFRLDTNWIENAGFFYDIFHIIKKWFWPWSVISNHAIASTVLEMYHCFWATSVSNRSKLPKFSLNLKNSIIFLRNFWTITVRFLRYFRRHVLVLCSFIFSLLYTDSSWKFVMVICILLHTWPQKQISLGYIIFETSHIQEFR